MCFWNEVVQETTTFTLPNPDEYERPEEIREIEVNRVKARSVAVEGDALSFGDKLRASLLGQLNEAMSDWEDRDLRRSFVHMQVSAGFAYGWRVLVYRFANAGVCRLALAAAIGGCDVAISGSVCDVGRRVGRQGAPCFVRAAALAATVVFLCRYPAYLSPAWPIRQSRHVRVPYPALSPPPSDSRSHDPIFDSDRTPGNPEPFTFASKAKELTTTVAPTVPSSRQQWAKNPRGC